MQYYLAAVAVRSALYRTALQALPEAGWRDAPDDGHRRCVAFATREFCHGQNRFPAGATPVSQFPATMSSRKPIWTWKKLLGILAVLVLPFVVIYGLTRTSLFGSIIAALGENFVLAAAVLLLVIFTLVSVVALIYGFGVEDPLKKKRHRRGPP
jgi:hypothetical protein